MSMRDPIKRRRQGVMAAVVLGTALTAFAPAPAAAVDDISRYCTACWRNAGLSPDCWADCTQEVFTRLTDRIDPADWRQVLASAGEEHREFLRAIDAVKKRTQRSRKLCELRADLVADQAADPLTQERRHQVDQAAADVLSERQQQIMRMSFEGWTVQEIAEQLDIGPERVSDEKYKAIRKLRAYLFV